MLDLKLDTDIWNYLYADKGFCCFWSHSASHPSHDSSSLTPFSSGVDLGEYTIKRSQLSEPALTQCMYAPNTYIEDVEYVEPIIEINGGYNIFI